MTPLDQLPTDDVGFVLTDIDDTLTRHGRLGTAAYAALGALHDAGIAVIPVTGRPAGWCDLIARLWPVDGVIGENGAFYMWHDAAHGLLRTRHLLTAAERETNTRRLSAIGEHILRSVPGCALASDQFCRLYDLAIDFCEDVPALEDADVARIVSLMEAAGMTAKISSIHVNGWFGDYDKLSMARRMLHERHGLDLDDPRQRARCVFVGDSPNDATMFGFFPRSVGVANVRRYAGQMTADPRYVTAQSHGEGFAEVARHLLGTA